jgi:hypothetical protein
VYGPVCVVDECLPSAGRSHPWKVVLIPAPDADPAVWIVNERLRYKKCKGCGASIVASGKTRMDREWTPKRAWYSRGRVTRDTAPGPHPAGTYACRELPRRRKPVVLKELADGVVACAAGRHDRLPVFPGEVTIKDSGPRSRYHATRIEGSGRTARPGRWTWATSPRSGCWPPKTA